MALIPLIQRVPERGTDYGSPHYGMDTFDFVFKQEQIHPPAKACVTVQGRVDWIFWGAIYVERAG